MKYAITIREETLDLIRMLMGGVLPEFEKVGRETWNDSFDCIVFESMLSVPIEKFEIMSEADRHEKYGPFGVQGFLCYTLKNEGP